MLSPKVELISASERVRAEAAQSLFNAAALKVNVEQELKLEQSRVFIVENNQTLHSVVAALVCWRLADEVEVLDLAVSVDVRRQGFGSTLLRQALLHEQRRGAQTAFLEVREDNDAARRLYESLGFKQNGSRPGYYSDGEDALLYQCVFSDLD